MRRSTYVLLLLLASALFSGPSLAHKLAPALLELRQLPSGTIGVMWRLPIDVTANLELRFSDDCRELSNAAPKRVGSGLEWHFDIVCADPAPMVSVEGLDPAQSAVLLRWWPRNGEEQQELLNSESPHFVMTDVAPSTHGIPQYLSWGVSHILIGFDHLLFVLGLFLVSSRWRQRLLWVTAFTLGHSLTLIAASTGLVAFNTSIVEIAIAASILVLALEINAQPSGHTRKGFLLLVLGFGLLHGLGFASVLGELGLPAGQQVPALLLFNLGVELGQLVFVALLAAVFGLIARGSSAALTASRVASIYLMGSFSLYWMVERAAGVLG